MLVLSCTLIDGICYSFVSKFDSNNNYITHIARFADRPQFESLLDAYFVTHTSFSGKPRKYCFDISKNWNHV